MYNDFDPTQAVHEQNFAPKAWGLFPTEEKALKNIKCQGMKIVKRDCRYYFGSDDYDFQFLIEKKRYVPFGKVVSITVFEKDSNYAVSRWEFSVIEFEKISRYGFNQNNNP